jgi:hypothetical protein
MLVNQFQQFAIHRFRFLLVSAAQRFRGAMVQVVAHQVSRHAAQRFLDAGDLRDDVRTVAVLFHHFLQAADLSLNSAQAVAVGFLDFRVHVDRFASGVACRAGAIRAGVVGVSKIVGPSVFPCGHVVYPLGLYDTPIPYLGQALVRVAMLRRVEFSDELESKRARQCRAPCMLTAGGNSLEGLGELRSGREAGCP